MFIDAERSKTRRQRYDEKVKASTKLPIAVATINFSFDENLAFIIRSAACFGITDLFVIGSIPDRSYLNPRTGSLLDYVNITSFANPRQFTEYCNEKEYKQVSVELTEDAHSIYEYEFSQTEKTMLILGNERTGIPAEILLKNDSVYIPMNGPGYCLNVSQAGTAVMSEYCRQRFINN